MSEYALLLGTTYITVMFWDLLKMQESGVEAFMADSWSIRRAAIAGREANGGNPMALTPVSDLSANYTSLANTLLLRSLAGHCTPG